jgi:peptidoglycan/xylan/chitin deacetylase (PgdA/CDA1 family)
MGGSTRRGWRWAIIACPVMVAGLAALGARRVDIAPPERPVTSSGRPRSDTSVCALPSQMKTILDVECQYQLRYRPRLEMETHSSPKRTVSLEIEAVYPAPLLAIEPAYPEPVAVVRLTMPTPKPVAEMPPLVALSFDTEIPHGEEARRTLTQVMNMLREQDVHATFFVVGSWARANPNVLRRLLADGHEIANHSLTHRRFLGRSAREVRAELDQVADIVLSETGAPIVPLFRPPYGCIDDAAAELARRDGYQLAGWTAAGRDAMSRTHTATEVVAAVKPDLRSGGIILLHTNHWITAAALPALLRLIGERGLHPVPVSALLQRDPSSAARLSQGNLRDCTLRAAHLTRRRHG